MGPPVFEDVKLLTNKKIYTGLRYEPTNTPANKQSHVFLFFQHSGSTSLGGKVTWSTQRYRHREAPYLNPPRPAPPSTSAISERTPSTALRIYDQKSLRRADNRSSRC